MHCILSNTILARLTSNEDKMEITTIALMMKAVISSETSVSIYQNTWWNNPELDHDDLSFPARHARSVVQWQCSSVE
jgi:hypothetical protein